MQLDLNIFDFDDVVVNTQEAANKIQWKYLSQHNMKMTFAQFAEKFSGATAFSIIETLKKEKNIKLFKSETFQLPSTRISAYHRGVFFKFNCRIVALSHSH